MAISKQLGDREWGKFKESTSSSGQTGIVVLNPDGSNVGASSVDGSTFTSGTTTGNIMQGVYQSTPTTVADGKAGAVGIDANRNLKTTMATAIAGEDLAADLTIVENRYVGSGVLTSDTSVKIGPGFIHTISFSQNDAAPTAGTIDLIDGLSAGATPKIWTWTLTTDVFTPFTITLDQVFSTGLYVDFTTTADVAVVVTYR